MLTNLCFQRDVAEVEWFSRSSKTSICRLGHEGKVTDDDVWLYHLLFCSVLSVNNLIKPRELSFVNTECFLMV